MITTLKKPLAFLFAFWSIVFAKAQIASDFFCCEESATDTAALQAKLTAVSTKVLENLPASEEKALRLIFRRLFNKYLRYYKQGSTLTETLLFGNYDCLSGSILFAHLLQKAGFHVIVYETNIHVFLTVLLSDGSEVLIETTDPVNGLVMSATAVAKRKEEYLRRFAAYREAETSHFRSEFQIMRTIPFEELAGLQCFNRAVAAYNRRRFALAADFLFKSQSLMNTERGMELMVLSLEGILASYELAPEKRVALLQAVEQYKTRLKHLPKLALIE